MANPSRERLQGFADPEDPNWQENLLTKVNAVAVKNARKHRNRKSNIQVFFDPPFKRLLSMAAEKRGMSIGSYARRAIGARIAADLHLPFADVMAFCPSVAPNGVAGTGNHTRQRTYDDGTGYGDWGVE